MKIALAQINTIVGDFEGNVAKILTYTQKAHEAACDLIVFPEFAVCGAQPHDLLERVDFVQQNYWAVNEICARAPHNLGIVLGFVEDNVDEAGKPLFNAVGLIYNGALIEKRYKRLIADYGIFDGGRYFEPGEINAPVEFNGVKLGFTICEDAWHDHKFTIQARYESNPVEDLMEQDCDILINVASSPYNTNIRLLRTALQQRICKKYQTPFIFVNQVGGNDGLIYDGASCAYDAEGAIIAQAVDFAQDLIIVDTDKNKGHMHKVTEDNTKAILKALVLGVRDFVQKNGFTKGLVGLSGGVDSALTLVIAVLALGRENVHAVYMPSLYSAEENMEDTAALCRNLEVKLDVVSISDLYQSMAKELNPEFNSANPSVAEMNLQARLRGALLMGYSNRDGGLLLTCGNKSEIATGYCTLYGDMCGALAVIGDIYKTEVYVLANTINQMYGKEVIPQRILDKTPSAELRPNQRDMDELPEYDELDLILQRYLDEGKSVEDILSEGFNQKAVHDTIRRIKNNEHKRFQAAPVLRVSESAFGPGRAYPLTQKFEAWNLKA